MSGLKREHRALGYRFRYAGAKAADIAVAVAIIATRMGIILGTSENFALAFAEAQKAAIAAVRNDNISKFKSRRVIDEGNVFPTVPSEYGQFVPFPIVLRAFIFHVLTPPQLRAYLHICCYAFGFRTESVPGQSVIRDIGVTTRKAVYGPSKRLSELGFVLQLKQGFEHDNPKSINFYQRPALEYTLLTLLEAKKISSGLIPLQAGRMPSTSVKREHEAAHGRLVEETLQHIIGPERYAHMQSLKREELRRSELIEALETALTERREKSKTESADRAKKRVRRARATSRLAAKSS